MQSAGRSRRRIISATLGLALLAAACGTELSDQERAQYLPGGQTAGGDTSAGDLTGAGTGDGSAVTTTPAVTGVAAGTDSGTTGGTAGASAGGSTPGGATAAPTGAKPCAAPSSEVGVTASTITLGGVFQLSGPVTGFAQQFLTGVRAKLAQANASGGVCGRKLEYLSRDDGFDAARNASMHRELFPKVLAIVGSFSTVDNGGASALQGTNVPDAAVAGTPERAALANHVSHSQFPNKDTPLPEWKYVAGHGGTRAVLVYVSLASARGLMDTYQAGMARAGIQVVKRIELSPTQFSYDATARDIANSGADVMFFLHETNAASAMAQALANTPNSLKFPVYSSFSYGQKFTQLAGAAAEGAETLVPFVPFEEAASNPATQVFMKWLQRVAPGESPTFDALNGWTSAEFFLQTLETVPGPITRAAVLKALQAVQDFNAGGAWAPSHPNDKGSGTCVVLLRVRAGKWTREAPGEGFIC